jgi:cytokinesis protein
MANGGGTESPISPTSSGAMDSLLEKLRAAAPQAKDQRDRRRRARLKERHQVRVASGQRMPNLMGAEADDGEGASMISTADAADHLAPQEDAKSNGAESVSEGEDIADRAANLLQGLRSNNTDTDEERTRRRRESAEDERRARRLRMRSRNAATNGSKDSADGLVLPSVRETSAAPEEDIQSPSAAASQPTPAIVVSSESGDQTTTDNNNDNSNHSQQGGQAEGEDVMDGSSPDRPVEISD